MQTDYKSQELNLYSNDNVGRLRFQDGKGTGLGTGFGQQQNYIFAKLMMLKDSISGPHYIFYSLFPVQNLIIYTI